LFDNRTTAERPGILFESRLSVERPDPGLKDDGDPPTEERRSGVLPGSIPPTIPLPSEPSRPFDTTGTGKAAF